MNPFQQQVTDLNAAKVIRNYQSTTAPQIDAAATGAGGFGGSRHALLASESQRNLNDQLAMQQSQDSYANWQQANQAFNADRSAALGAAGQYGSLAEENQTLGLRDAAALSAAGGQQQQQNQTGLDIGYNDFLQQREYPKTQTNYLQGILGGFQAPTSTSTNTATSGSSPLSQIAGAGVAGLGFLGATGAFGSSGYLGKLFGGKTGGPVTRRYAKGGRVGGLTSLLEKIVEKHGGLGEEQSYADGGYVLPSSMHLVPDEEDPTTAGYRPEHIWFQNNAPTGNGSNGSSSGGSDGPNQSQLLAALAASRIQGGANNGDFGGPGGNADARMGPTDDREPGKFSDINLTRAASQVNNSTLGSLIGNAGGPLGSLAGGIIGTYLDAQNMNGFNQNTGGPQIDPTKAALTSPYDNFMEFWGGPTAGSRNSPTNQELALGYHIMLSPNNQAAAHVAGSGQDYMDKAGRNDLEQALMASAAGTGSASASQLDEMQGGGNDVTSNSSDGDPYGNGSYDGVDWKAGGKVKKYAKGGGIQKFSGTGTSIVAPSFTPPSTPNWGPLTGIAAYLEQQDMLRRDAAWRRRNPARLGLRQDNFNEPSVAPTVPADGTVYGGLEEAPARRNTQSPHGGTPRGIEATLAANTSLQDPRLEAYLNGAGPQPANPARSDQTVYGDVGVDGSPTPKSTGTQEDFWSRMSLPIIMAGAKMGSAPRGESFLQNLSAGVGAGTGEYVNQKTRDRQDRLAGVEEAKAKTAEEARKNDAEYRKAVNEINRYEAQLKDPKLNEYLRKDLEAKAEEARGRAEYFRNYDRTENARIRSQTPVGGVQSDSDGNAFYLTSEGVKYVTDPKTNAPMKYTKLKPQMSDDDKEQAAAGDYRDWLKGQIVPPAENVRRDMMKEFRQNRGIGEAAPTGLKEGQRESSKSGKPMIVRGGRWEYE